MDQYRLHIGALSLDLRAEQIASLDIVEQGADIFHVIHEEKSLEAKLIKGDSANKTYSISVNGNVYEVKIEDQVDLLVKEMGLSANSNQAIKHIKAPMPGLVLDILVEEGAQIQKGDGLLILEAMKMENVLKAEGEGTVKSIEVQGGASVDKGQLLIELE